MENAIARSVKAAKDSVPNRPKKTATVTRHVAPNANDAVRSAAVPAQYAEGEQPGRFFHRATPRPSILRGLTRGRAQERRERQRQVHGREQTHRQRTERTLVRGKRRLREREVHRTRPERPRGERGGDGRLDVRHAGGEERHRRAKCGKSSAARAGVVRAAVGSKQRAARAARPRRSRGAKARTSRSRARRRARRDAARLRLFSVEEAREEDAGVESVGFQGGKRRGVRRRRRTPGG